TIDPTTVDSNPFNAENFTVYAAGRSEGYPLLGGADGGIYKSTDAGASWTTIDNGIATISGNPYMGTVRAIVLDPQSCTSPPCAAGSDPLQSVYVAGSGVAGDPGMPYQSARVYKSTNAGTTWSASENGLPLPEDLGPVGTFNYLYSIAISMVIDPVTPSTLYVGTSTGWSASFGGSIPTMENGVFKSTNGGATWVHSSNGLPRYAGAGSTHYDVLALAINPFNTQVLYAGATSFELSGAVGSIYKSTDGGANWLEASTGIAGKDVRALFIDPADHTGDTIYAGTGGTGADPGGVYRTTNGGATWNSLSIGLPANAALALTKPPRALGAPARIIAGTTAGVWEYTATPDEDSDGSPSAVEQSVLGGDGNGDGISDATQSSVASTSTAGGFGVTGTTSPDGTVVRTTIAIVAGSCTQLNDSTNQQASLYPPDPIDAAASHEPWGLVSFALPACSQATVQVTFHGGNFDANWRWRNYGPRIPGDATTFGWYSFSGAQRIDAETWELVIDASLQG
ncbi:WD40/YVTN/BNR-like repeat-containing protein, partial [Dokdonella sp.]|uniref:WD40/YVTN/BNR-like repeat-containing protein n=1 Tax=Dokdonella sp. TaxID=2291710 RepID=UPI003C4E62A1